MDPQFNDDDYDAINAPQFLDFSLLGINSDDEEADRFFETHKEEDDNFIPVENLSPTIHLMCESVGYTTGRESGEPSDINSCQITRINETIDDANVANVASPSPSRDSKAHKICYLTEPENKNVDEFINDNGTSLEYETAIEGKQESGSPKESLMIQGIERLDNDSSFEDDKEGGTEAVEGEAAAAAENFNPEPEVRVDEQPESDKENLNTEHAPAVPAPKSPERRKRHSSMPETRAKEIPKQTTHRPIIHLHSKYTTKVTIPQPFNLHQTRPRTRVETKESEFKFKAKPVPIKALQGPAMKRKIETKVTEPKAPHFASEDRIRERQEKKAAAATLSLPDSPKNAGNSKKSGPSSIASSSRSCRPPTPKKMLPPTPTKVQPFSFAARDEEMFKKKEQKIQQIQQELEKKMEPVAFHAKPLPSFKPNLPKKLLIEVTNVEPFKLQSDERGAAYQQAWKAKLEKEEREMKENKIFHANPPAVLYKKPFEPVLGILPLAEPLDIQLNTDRRARERELYEEQMKEKEREEEEERQEEEAMRREQERQEQIQLRKQLVHKPNPLKPLRVFQVKGSDKPLTNPKSPAFAPLPSQRRGMEKEKLPSNGGLNTPM